MLPSASRFAPLLRKGSSGPFFQAIAAADDFKAEAGHLAKEDLA